MSVSSLSPRRDNLLKAAVATASLALCPVVAAQSSLLLEEVVVVAQKREQSVQDIPVSVTAFSGDAMRDLGFESSMDLAAQTPGLMTAQNFGEGNNPIISIRGVTMLDFTEINESPSAVYVDDFYKANLASLDFQLFDLERAEVLRGPQGTLFGRNSTGGLIHYLTAKPTQELTGYAEFTAGEYGKQKFEGAVGGGLAENVSARLSVIYDKHDGYIKNTGFEDGNQRDTLGVRGQLLFTPGERTSVLASFSYGENENAGGNTYVHEATTLDPVTGLGVYADTDFLGYAGPPLDDRRTNLNFQPAMEVEVATSLLRIEHEFDAFQFVSITGYETVEKVQNNDPDVTPIDVFRTQQEPEGTQFSQEFQLLGETESFDWITGLYLFDYENKGRQFADLPLDGIRQDVNWKVDTSSWALFAQIDYRLSEQWSTIFGIRYTEEDKDFESTMVTEIPGLGVIDIGLSQDFTRGAVGNLTEQDADDISFNWRLNYQPSDDLLIYGGVSTGFKGGTYNISFFPLADVNDIPVGEENLLSYELGFKSTLMDGRANFNGAVFYYDYEDYQAYLFDGDTLSSFLFNNDAEVMGAELEFFASPTEGLDIVLGLSWLDATLNDVADQADLVGGIPQVKDRDMPLAPDLSANALVRYTFDAFGGSLALQADGRWVGDQFFDPVNSPALEEDAYFEANVRATWRSADDRWYLVAFVDNVTDETYRNYGFDLSSAIGVVEAVVNRPRWYGASVGFNW